MCSYSLSFKIKNMSCALAVGTTDTSLKPGMLPHGPGTDTACKDGSCDMQSTPCSPPAP